jgi:acetylornithine deacetylase/succinyl-diaminopimelate desuccinylase-like protein
MNPLSPVELLGDLIRIPSVNPEGDPGVDEPGEARLAVALEGLLLELGAEVWLREVMDGRPNVVARFPSDRPGKPKLLLAPHTDTVSVVGMTIPPFGGEVSDGKIWGRGASDTKGSMAAMLCALARLKDRIPTLGYEIWFAGLMGEESGQFGAKALASEEQFDFVIAGEPTELKTVQAHKGSLWVTLIALGKAVHASAPDTGENAIYKMSSAIEKIRASVIPELARDKHPVLGHSTLSVGTIRGGSKTNIVPDHCEATLDIRTIPGEDPLRIINLIQNAAPGLEISHQGSSPLYTDPSHSLIQKLASLGATPVGAPWFCDAAVFAAKGMPAVALGPGSIAQAHTADEFISVKDLEEGANFFTTFLESL